MFLVPEVEGSLPIRGINYDTGVNYAGNELSRAFWHPRSVEHDMEVIATELGCTAVAIFGTKHERLEEAATLAASHHLDVWLQPRLIEGTWNESLEHLGGAARIAEDLRTRHHAAVTLNVGCELSLFMKGVLPGKDFMWRMRGLMVYWMAMPAFNRRLNAYLCAAAQTAREYFSGPITYSAGEWEGVDWDPFDYVGVDYYRDSHNRLTYVDGLRKLAAHGKPVIVTEFGCCSFRGADKKGGAGFMIVNWRSDPPIVKAGFTRDEQVQADYIGELVELYKEEGVHGAFVYAFSEPSNIHTEDPRTDLDMASYGLVKVVRGDTADEPEVWQEKLAFSRLAGAYGDSRTS